MDRAERLKQERARWSWELWDHVSPINGVEANDIMRLRSDIPKDGVVYLIYRDGELLYFQPHDPDEPGHKKMGFTRARSMARKHVERLVEESVGPPDSA